MIKHNIPLYALESGDPVSDFDFIGFTLQYELSFTNMLNMLRLSGVPIKSCDRKELKNIVVAGGPCACNPEPIADFVDIFFIDKICNTKLGVRRRTVRLQLTMLVSSFLSQLLIGTPESLSILSIFVKLSSYWRVNPIKSKIGHGISAFKRIKRNIVFYHSLLPYRTPSGQKLFRHQMYGTAFIRL